MYKLIEILAKHALMVKQRIGRSNDPIFDRKILKIYKALRVMEKQKQGRTDLSQAFKQLMLYLYQQQNNIAEEGSFRSNSKISKLEDLSSIGKPNEASAGNQSYYQTDMNDSYYQ